MKKMARQLYNMKSKIIGLIFLGIVGLFVWKIGLPVYNFAKANSLGISFVKNAFFSQRVPLNGTNDRTNVLFMGTDLTDTMLVYSFNQTTKKSYIVAVPADVWSDTLKDKINSAYHYGETKKKGGGFLLAKATVEEVIGEPIHYAYLVDFAGFETIIDVLGGVGVNVERSFDDLKYPIEGLENDTCDGDPDFACRYEYLHFNAGLQYMDGATALKFIRSRNARGEEGSDFARSKRQEKVLDAVKNRLLDRTTYTSFTLVSNLVSQFKSSTQTDANLGESLYVGKLFLQLKDRKTINIESELINPPVWQYDSRWVLIPKESWGSLHSFITKSLAE